MYLLECSIYIYILKYVVAAAVRCGVWEEVHTPVHATEGVISRLMLHSCSGFPERGPVTQCRISDFSIYIGQFRKRFAFTLHCVARVQRRRRRQRR